MAPHMEAEDRSRTGNEDTHPSAIASEKVENQVPRWRDFLGTSKLPGKLSNSKASSAEFKKTEARPAKSSLGILNDKETAEVPGA